MQKVQSRYTEINVQLCTHSLQTQARTHTHTPTRSGIHLRMFLAEDLTAATLASLPMYPPFPNSFSHGLSPASLRSPEAQGTLPCPRGPCPDHGLRPSVLVQVWLQAASPVGTGSGFPHLVSPGLGGLCPHTRVALPAALLPPPLSASTPVSFYPCAVFL